MTEQPPGGWPPQPESPTQPYPVPPPPGQPGYPQAPAYPPQSSSGYPPPPTYWQPGAPPPPPPPEDHTARNIVIGVIAALIVVLILGGLYVYGNQPQPSLPVIIPTATPFATPAAEATKTPKPTKAPATEAPITQAPPTEELPTEQPPTEQPPTEAPPTAVEPTPEQTTQTPTQAPPTGAVSSPLASTIPGVEQDDIIIGDPVIIGNAIFSQIALFTQNTSNLVKSYGLTATFSDGKSTTATAEGFVSDHLPGTIRTPTLFIDGQPGPNDTLTVAIDSVFSEDPSTPEGDVALATTFGEPTLNISDVNTVDVDVTNGSESTVSESVTAAIVRDGVIVGIGSTFVTDLAPGDTQTATMFVNGSMEDTDQVLLTVDSVTISQ